MTGERRFILRLAPGLEAWLHLPQAAAIACMFSDGHPGRQSGVGGCIIYADGPVSYVAYWTKARAVVVYVQRSGETA